MRRIITLCTLLFTFHAALLPAQQMVAPTTEESLQPIDEPIPEELDQYKPPAKPSEWQNWIFAGSALLTAAIGVLVVSLDNGSGAQSH